MENTNLHVIDWGVIALFAVILIGISLYFTRRGSRDIDSFFISGRALPWYVSGISMIATSFASDTPLWITNLIRQYGVHYVWQYWAPAIGGSLAVVLFSRLIRRSGVVTDVEIAELRYSGRSARALRFITGFVGAIVICPLICAWVTKAMGIIAAEAFSIAPENMKYVTVVIVGLAVVACSASGLWGVAYGDFFQFIIATGGTVTLAILSVKQVGGLSVLIEKLSAMEGWTGKGLSITPSIGPADHQMSAWNAIGYFAILWWGPALCGGYVSQRVLACKNVRHASLATLLNSVVYYALIAWPWVLVGLCSLVLLPDLGEGVTGDHAYPRMIFLILPIGLRGMLIAAMLAAFVSTMSTLFNWGASYLVNDIYKRFLHPQAQEHHYVGVSRLVTIGLAIGGGILSHQAERIQDLLAVFYVISAGSIVYAILSWLWWRLNATAAITGYVLTWVLTFAMLFCRVFQDELQDVLGKYAVFVSSDYYLGARMLVTIAIITVVTIGVSLVTPPTEMAQLQKFVRKVKPFRFGWGPVIDQMEETYQPPQGLAATAISWVIAVVNVFSLLLGVGYLLLGRKLLGIALCILFCITLVITIQRLRRDTLNGERD